MAELHLERDEGGSDEVEEKSELVEAIGDDRGRPFVGGLGLHPSGHVLPTEGDVAAHAGEELFRDGDLQNRLEPVVSVDVGTQTPHDWIRSENENVGNRREKGGIKDGNKMG